jgi:hypothetical protein
MTVTKGGDVLGAGKGERLTRPVCSGSDGAARNERQAEGDDSDAYDPNGELAAAGGAV